MYILDGKAVTAADLARIAAALPQDALVMVNLVGNLLVFSADAKVSLGFIDLGAGEFEAFEGVAS